MINKAKDAEKLNIENEKIVRLQDELRRKELEVAAREMRISTDEKVNSLNNLINADSPVILAKLPSQILFTHDGHDGEVNALKWVTDSEKYQKTNILATGGADRKVKIWLISSTSATVLDTFTNSNASITSIDVDGDCLLASSSDFASRLWTINDSRLRRTFTGHSSKVTTVKFLGKPSKSVSGSYDRTIKIWDINKHVCIRTLFAGSSCNDLVTRQGQESEVISGHFDKSIRFWDVRTDSSANSIQLQGKITSLTILPNSFQLLSSDRGDTLKLLDLRMNQVIRNYYADGFKIGCDWTRACVSPDGEYVVAGSSDGIVYIWNTLSGKIEKELKGAHTSNVNACSWSPNCQYFVSCDKNKKFAIWGPYNDPNFMSRMEFMQKRQMIDKRNLIDFEKILFLWEFHVENQGSTVVNASATSPEIRLRITDSSGQDVQGTKLGEQLQLRIELKNEDSALDMQATHLIAMSGHTQQQIALIDHKG
ncbi:hypothetical protein RND71_044027 [Anisodus tanguticus]|uniref:Uncharacterized protein n=1 Tax=Anisodus tanguticus TaxID=243964 RepID=A0AAE1UTG5_9SOLA|nr:hypothetical protein RND71_044027 [Anisodus tanguticus]